MLDAVFGPIDATFDFLPAWARILTWGLVDGAATMLLYGWLSDQEKIADIQEDVKAARAELNAYDGTDFSVVMKLSRASLRHSLRQLGVMLLPTLLAAIPVLLTLAWMEAAFVEPVLELGPEWLRTWHATFLTGLSISAVVVKYGFDIK